LEYKVELHNHLFELSFNSQGMLSFSDVYNMPIYLRKFYFKRLQKHYKDESEAIKKANQKNKSSPPIFKK